MASTRPIFPCAGAARHGRPGVADRGGDRKRLLGLGDVVDAQHRRAGPGGGERQRDRAAEPLVRVDTRRRSLAIELLRLAPGTTGKPSAAICGRPRILKLRVVGWRLAEAEAGIDPDPFTRATPAATAASARALQEGGHLGHDILVARPALHRARLNLHGHQHHLASELRGDIGAVRRPAQRGDAPSFHIKTPAAIAARAAAGFMVSTEIGMSLSWRTASITGATQAISSASAASGARGRVDLAANVEDVGPLGDQPPGVRERRPPTVREPARHQRSYPGVTLTTSNT